MAEESKLTVERLSALLGISDSDETVKVHLEFTLENAEDAEGGFVEQEINFYAADYSSPESYKEPSYL